MKKPKIIAAICLLAQSFTSLILSLVYAGRKKEVSKAFLGFGLLGGLGGAYLLYSEYQDEKENKLAADSDNWCCDDDCCDDDLDFFDDGDADDINFTIAEEKDEKNEGADENAAPSEESAE